MGRIPIVKKFRCHIYTASGTDGVLIDAAVQQAKSEGLVIAVSPTGAAAPGMKEACAEQLDPVFQLFTPTEAGMIVSD